MRRVLLGLVLLAATLGLAPAAPAQAHDSTTILAGCTGYVVTESYTTAAGNTYESKRNLCLGLNSFSGNPPTYWVEAVERAKCYRNGALYAGCRWDGYTDNQFWSTVLDDWVGLTHDYWCDTCGGSFISDSGRHYGTHVGYESGELLRIIGNNRRVTIRFADGSQLTFGESGRTAGPVTCCNW